jgi:exo-beta-1,3-glucanase (GH17 family)
MGQLSTPFLGECHSITQANLDSQVLENSRLFPGAVVQKVWDVRRYLNNVIRYKASVSIVSTWATILNNPVLCNVDYITINAHAFYDGNVQAAGGCNSIIKIDIPNIKSVYAPYPAVSNIVINESGWPLRGRNTNVFALEAGNSTWRSVSDNERTQSSPRPRTRAWGGLIVRFGILNKSLDCTASSC